MDTDEHSVVSNLTMSTTLTDRDLSVEAYEFPQRDINGPTNNQDLDQASQSTPEATCLPFEKTLDAVFTKIYESFLDEEAIMWVCQDDPSEGTPILEYPGSDKGIPTVISTDSQEHLSAENTGSSGSMLPKNLKTFESSALSADGYSPSIKKEDSNEEPTSNKPLSSSELDAIVPTSEPQKEEDTSPFRLDSLLNSSRDVSFTKSRGHRRSQSIEVNDSGCVVFDQTFETIDFEVEDKEEEPPKIPVVPKQTSTLEPPSDLPHPDTSMSLAPATDKDESFGSHATAPTTNQTSFNTSVDSSSAKLKSSKKRSLGLRYLFSPRMRKMISWRRRRPKKYHNMKKLDDPSYSPETVTTFGHTSSESDGLSFQCDISSKISVMNSIKQDPLHSPQKSLNGSRCMDEPGSLSYAYPQSMVA